MEGKRGCGCGGKSKGVRQSMPADMKQFVENQVRSRSPLARRGHSVQRSIDDIVRDTVGVEGDSPATRLDQVRVEGPDGSILPPLV